VMISNTVANRRAGMAYYARQKVDHVRTTKSTNVARVLKLVRIYRGEYPCTE